MSKRIISDPAILGGTPVFRGTRVPLEHIAGLIRNGVPSAEIAEDYPALSTQDIAYARAYVRKAKPSASRESRTVKPIQLRRKTRAA
jgi:uncharacterized protein (DUF433 family)